MKKLLVIFRIIAIGAVFDLVLAGCDTSPEGGDSWNDSYSVTYVTVTFTSGRGDGITHGQTVSVGTVITLPDQDSMRPPSGAETFIGWECNGTTYTVGQSYTVNSNVIFNALWAAEGIYVGIISFAGDVTDLTNNKPVLLDDSGRNELINYLNWGYNIADQSGTAIFYSVHKALANLKTNETNYPSNLDSVNIVTFTDGLDNASDGRAAINPIENKTFNSATEYADYVNGEITNRRIADKMVSAYSVGIRGEDVTDIPGFQNNLAKIASPGKSNELTDFSDVQDTFNTIASSLNTVHTNPSFTLVTTLLSNGTKVRMTFDTVTENDPATSSRYIEGTITRTGTTYTFNTITYGGRVGSSKGAGQ